MNSIQAYAAPWTGGTPWGPPPPSTSRCRHQSHAPLNQSVGVLHNLSCMCLFFLLHFPQVWIISLVNTDLIWRAGLWRSIRFKRVSEIHRWVTRPYCRGSLSLHQSTWSMIQWHCNQLFHGQSSVVALLIISYLGFLRLQSNSWSLPTTPLFGILQLQQNSTSRGLRVNPVAAIWLPLR